MSDLKLDRCSPICPQPAGARPLEGGGIHMLSHLREAPILLFCPCQLGPQPCLGNWRADEGLAHCTPAPFLFYLS